MHWRYTAVGRDNSVIEGVVDAPNDAAAEERLLQQGLRALSIRSTSNSEWWRGLLPTATSVGRKELSIFSQQLAILLNAGTPLLTALGLLRDQTRTELFRVVVATVIADLKSGSSLHEAMIKHPNVFPRVYVRLIEAGERSGSLETVLRHLAAYLDKEAAAMQQLKKALTYPAIVLAVALVVIGVMVTMVLPTMTDMLAQFNADLPLITRALIAMSDAIEAYRLYGLLVLVALTATAIWYFKRPEGQWTMGRMLLTLPWIGRLTARRSTARFSRTMALLLGAGLPVPDSLAMAREGSGNVCFREALSHAREQVIAGRSLGQSLEEVGYFPGLFIQMVRAGEESGVLEGNLNSMADLYEREVDEQLQTATGLLEPAITVGMGLTVGIIALAVLLPMFSLMSNLET